MRRWHKYVTPIRDRKGATLPEAVIGQFGRCCPCCGRSMVGGQVKRFQRTPHNHRTVAHDFSVARGGDPRVWFYGCHLCNNEQGMLDLVTWARKLIHIEDPRAARVTELAIFLRKWVANAKEDKAA